MYYTHKNELLRSTLEKTFYDILYENNIEYLLDKQYPNQNNKSKYRYDFYIPIVDEYIEIAGLRHLKYLNILNKKIEKFNCIVLFNFNDILEYCNNLIERICVINENKKNN